MSLKLFELGPTRSARVRWTLTLLGLPFESVEGRHLFHSPELVAVSPLGKLPGFVDDGRPLFESAAICTWLADSHPEQGLSFPSGSWERALHDQWVSFCLTELEAHLWSSARNAFVYPEERRIAAIHAQNEQEARRALKVLDDHLATRSFMVAERFTVTDIILVFATSWAREIGWSRGYARCEAYTERLLALPGCPYRHS
jgi:glutathione S-transferase